MVDRMLEITEITQLILEGYVDDARDRYLKYRLYPYTSSIYYAEWSKVGELLGLYHLAKEDIETALKMHKSFNIDYLYQYVKLLLLLDENNYKSIKILQKIVKVNPNYKNARQLLINLYKKIGWHNSVKQLDTSFQLNKNNSIRTFHRNIGKDTLIQFRNLLGGRKDIYAEESLDKTGNSYLKIVKNHLNLQILAKHLLGQVTLYWFPINENLKTNIIAIKYYISPNRFSPLEDKKYISELIFDSFWEGYNYLETKGIPVVGESLSNYSARLWIFLEPACHFLQARKITKYIIQILPITKPKVQIRPILPTRPQSVHWIEYPISIPVGIDINTGHRRELLNKNTKKPMQDQINFIEKINRIDIKRLIKKIANNTYTFSYYRVKSTFDNELKILTNRCSVIAYILKKIDEGKILSRPEKIILFYTIGLIDPTRELLHKVLTPCPDYKYKKIQRQAQKIHPRPISCLKIKELLPNITSILKCDCIFDDNLLKEGRYPSPILHVEPKLIPTIEERFTAKFCTAKELARQYLVLRQELNILKERQKQLEKQLLLAMYSEKRNKIKLDNKILRYDNKGIKII